MDLNELERLAAAAVAGPWKECGHDRGGCSCGFVYSVPADAPVATVTIGQWGDEWPELRQGDDGKPEAFTQRTIYGEIPEQTGKATAAFIAAANPAAVLELIRLARLAPATS